MSGRYRVTAWLPDSLSPELLQGVLRGKFGFNGGITIDIYEDLEYMRRGLERGALTRKRLDEAVTRILALKARVAGKVPTGAMLHQAKEWRAEMADKAVALIKNTQDVLPLTPDVFRSSGWWFSEMTAFWTAV